MKSSANYIWELLTNNMLTVSLKIMIKYFKHKKKIYKNNKNYRKNMKNRKQHETSETTCKHWKQLEKIGKNGQAYG